MGSEKIERLLEKYFDAAATMAEENELREYFLGDKVAPHLNQYAPLFRYFSESQKDRYTKPIFAPKNSVQDKRGGSQNFRYGWIAVAASVLLVAGLYFGENYREKQKAEYALEQTKMAFDLLAENFSRGTEKMAYLKEFNVAKQKIYKSEDSGQ